MAEEDLIFWHGQPVSNKGQHGSETVSAADNVTVLSQDECDFWQMNAVIPSGVQQVTRLATCILNSFFLLQGCMYTWYDGAESSGPSDLISIAERETALHLKSIQQIYHPALWYHTVNHVPGSTVGEQV